jgi:type VI secretion system protein ImpL
MKGLLKTSLRVLLWTVLAAVILGGAYFAALLAGIDPKIVPAGAVLLAALILCLIFGLRAISRHRRRLQIQQVVTVSPDAPRDNIPEQRLIDNRWNRAVSILRTSYLGGSGNPIYALPWYMVMGKTGAGKSSAIGHCGLNAMQTDVGPDREHASTRNCDWHFFREGMVLDTAGRYAVPLDETADGAEWREFLQQLAKYRRRETLNGLVIAIAADTLYGKAEHLLAEARCLRRRLDETMRVLGAKFPVYLMVTKLDLLAGVARVLESIPPEARQHALGALIQSPDRKSLVPVGAQIRNTLDDIQDGFRSLFLYRCGKTSLLPAHRILAWEEIKAMMPALAVYADELFADNPYQETPLLRGIFFSSALRTDADRQSRAFPGLADLMRGLLRTQENSAGFFLRDFFSLVLPPDRNLNRPIREYLRWQSSARVFAYAGLLLLTFGLVALLSLSYRHNDALLRQTRVPAALSMKDTLAPSRLLAFEQRFRDTEQMEKKAAAWALPSMGLNQGQMGLKYFYRALNEAFLNDIFTPIRRGLNDRLSRLTDRSGDSEFFGLASDLVWNFDLVSAAQEGKSFQEMLKIPAMPQAGLDVLGAGDIPMLAQPLAYSLARYYYNEKPDSDALAQTLRAYRAALARLPAINGYSLQWLINRASVLNDVPPVKGGRFWPGALSGPLDEVLVDPPHTAAGFKVTLDYLNRLSLIVSDDALKSHTQEFLRWYAGGCVDAWKNFTAAFNQKILSLATVSLTGDVAAVMASDANPFFALALRMEEELRPAREYLEQSPPWLNDLDLFADALRLETSANVERVQPGLVQRVREDVRRAYETATDNILDSAAQERHARAQLLVKEIQAYLASLHELVRFSFSSALAFNAVQEAMPNEKNSAAATAKLTLARAALYAMRLKIDPGMADDSPMRLVDSGPYAFFLARLVNGASCHIQNMWEGTVLTRAGALTPMQLQQGLFAEQGGLARNFADNTLKYFLNETLQGYEPQKLRDVPIPFTSDFLQFLNAGLMDYRPMPQSYAVTVDAVPVDVNDEALEKPYAVTLVLDCAQDKQELTNYNSPASKRFSWQRDGCGDAGLTIRFKSVTLNVDYAGASGFVDFLHDFQYGEKTFHPADFPGQEALLKKLGITDITLRYKFAGAGPVLHGATYTPGTLPFVAAECRR